MLNKFICIARLVEDPELKHTRSEVPVTTVRIAIKRDYTAKAEAKDITDFFDAVAWRSTAEFICNNFHKGKLICLVGRLQNRAFEDKDGNKRTVTELQVDDAHFAGDKSPTESGGQSQPSPFDSSDAHYPFGGQMPAPSPFDN